MRVSFFVEKKYKDAQHFVEKLEVENKENDRAYKNMDERLSWVKKDVNYLKKAYETNVANKSMI